ncbi:MAG TPA: UDP-N-acetylmuramoyl-tripeptide--D-alanyl-D-alanine ligase [Opitutales bacterium]|nr:UDP-N-acetylmuramoyl-tripeptide--D-alanyl-D-alanine ligase [Opitutales bacterium]
MEFTAEQLKEWSGGIWTREPAEPIRGFAFDSRQIGPGELFVCLKTDRRDGHDFIGNAAAAGAGAALVARECSEIDLPQLVVADPLCAFGKMAAVHRENFEGPVIGVTGSCGKTSTKDLLALLLGEAGEVHATEGNFNNLIGVPMTLLGLDPSRHKCAVIEAGINQPGEMEKLAAMIQPTHAIVTLIAPAHLEQLGDLEGVAREKSILVRDLPHWGAAILPASCLLYEDFYDLTAPIFKVAPLEDAGVEDADLRFRVEQQDSQTVLHLESERVSKIFRTRKISAGIAANAALAIQTAFLLDVSEEKIQERLSNWKPSSFRGEIVDCGARQFYVDCYNANPAAMEDSLEFFRELSAGSEGRLYVIGCMGELGSESESYHRDLGRRICLDSGDRMLVTGERGEARAFCEGLLAAGNSADQVSVFSRTEEIEADVASHRGFVFLKGSRVYGLESLLEKPLAGEGGESC